MGKVSRREFLRFSALGAVGLLAASCAPGAQPAQPEQGQATAVPAAAAVPQGTAAPAGEAVKLQYWHGWSVDEDRKAMEDAVQLFNDSHPDIQVEAITGKTNDAVMAAVSGGSPPDAYSLWSTQTLAQWAVTGVIVDLDELAKGAGIDEKAFYPSALEIAQYQGKWFGLPIEIDAGALYWNKGLFKDGGLDPEKPPQTMEELLQWAEELTKLDSAGNITQLGYSGGWSEAEYTAYVYGGRWWEKASGQPTASDPGNVAAWTAMPAYYKKFTAELVNTFNSAQADNPLGSQFLAGRVAMALDGDWITNYMRRYAPDTEWGVAPLPPTNGRPELKFSSGVDGSIYVVPTGAPHLKESWEFVRWMGTSKEAACVLQKVWANAAPMPEAARSCLPNPECQVFIDIMDAGKMHVWPPIAVSAMYNTELHTAYDRVIYGKQTAEESLAELQAKVEDELKKIGG